MLLVNDGRTDLLRQTRTHDHHARRRRVTFVPSSAVRTTSESWAAAVPTNCDCTFGVAFSAMRRTRELDDSRCSYITLCEKAPLSGAAVNGAEKPAARMRPEPYQDDRYICVRGVSRACAQNATASKGWQLTTSHCPPRGEAGPRVRAAWCTQLR